MPDDLPNDSAEALDTSDKTQANAEVGEMNQDAPAGRCPVLHDGGAHPTQGDANSAWWPERLNLKTLAAVCDILSVTPADLVEVTVAARRAPKTAAAAGPATVSSLRPRRARIVRDDKT